MSDAAHRLLTKLISRVSGTPPTSNALTDISFDPAISSDGRYVAFDSSASNLDSDNRESGFRGIYLHDRVAGTTRLITGNPDNQSINASISGDGRFVAFRSRATNFGPLDSNGRRPGGGRHPR